MDKPVQFATPKIRFSQNEPGTVEFNSEISSEISRCAQRVIMELRCSVLTAPLTPYSPKDQIESVYRLKADLKLIVYYTLKVVEDILLDYIQTTLNPFLVEWHAHYYHEWLGEYSDEKDLKFAFSEALISLRQSTANLQTKLEEMLDEME